MLAMLGFLLACALAAAPSADAPKHITFTERSGHDLSAGLKNPFRRPAVEGRAPSPDLKDPFENALAARTFDERADGQRGCPEHASNGAVIQRPQRRSATRPCTASNGPPLRDPFFRAQ
jgi:hypothetical protein